MTPLEHYPQRDTLLEAPWNGTDTASSQWWQILFCSLEVNTFHFPFLAQMVSLKNLVFLVNFAGNTQIAADFFFSPFKGQPISSSPLFLWGGCRSLIGIISLKWLHQYPLCRLLLRLDPAPAEYEADTVDIFGLPWVTETALVESSKLLFGLLRWSEMGNNSYVFFWNMHKCDVNLCFRDSKHFCFFKTYLLHQHWPLLFIHISTTDHNLSLFYFRQKIYRLETLVQSSSHDFGKLHSNIQKKSCFWNTKSF